MLKTDAAGFLNIFFYPYLAELQDAWTCSLEPVGMEGQLCMLSEGLWNMPHSIWTEYWIALIEETAGTKALGLIQGKEKEEE